MKLFGNRIAGAWTDYYQKNLFVKRLVTILGIDILVKASGFILLPVYLRLMSQEEFGLYNYLLSIIFTLSLVLNLGLYIPQSKLYHSIESPHEKGRLLYTIAATLLIFLAATGIITYIFKLDYQVIDILFKSDFPYHQYRGTVLLALIGTILSFMLTNFFFTSEKIKQVKAYNIYRIVAVNVLTLSALLFVKGDTVKIRLLTTYTIEFLLICIFGYHFIKETVSSFNKKLMVTCLKMGLPIMVSALFGIIINFSDKFLLEKYGTLTDLSNYYLAFSFASIIPLIFASLQNLWIPVFMKEKNFQKNIEKTQKLLAKLLSLFLPLSFLIWLLFKLLLSTQVIDQKYSEVIFILPILLVTQIFAALAPLYSNYLVYLEKTQLVTVAGLLVSIVSLGLGLWLIPIWGVYGAAFTSLVSNLFYLIIYYRIVLLYKKKFIQNSYAI